MAGGFKVEISLTAEGDVEFNVLQTGCPRRFQAIVEVSNLARCFNGYPASIRSDEFALGVPS